MKNNVFLKKWNRKYIPYVILFVVMFIVGFPLLRTRMLEGHDGVFQLFRNYTTKVAIADGQFIPMVNPNMMGGFGYASNLFYGILSTYIITFFSFFTPTIGLAINLFILLILFLSGLFMYFFVYDFSKKKDISLLSAIFYMTAPYLLYDIYVRMALGEIASFVFVPLLFHGLYSIINSDKKKWYLLTIGTSGLLLSHSISTFMCAIFATFYIVLNIKKVLEKEIILKITIAILFALLISLPTVLPLLEAKLSSDYMVFDSVYMKTNGAKMESHAIHLFESSFKMPTIIVQIYIVFIIGIVLFFIKKKKISWDIRCYFILFIISVFLTLDIIPWSFFPNLFSTLQFPWRFLQLSSFFFALTLAFLLQEIQWKGKSLRLVIVACCLLSAIPFLKLGISNPGIDNHLVYSNKLKKRENIVRSTGTASAEYLPRNAIYNYHYLKNHSMLPTLLKGNGKIEQVKKVGTHLTFELELQNSSLIELPFIYYPGYVVKANGKDISTLETKNGLVGISLKKGKYHVTNYYRGSNVMIFAYITSLISCFVFIILILKQKNLTCFQKQK